MPNGEVSSLELHRELLVSIYRLNGLLLCNGDPLEVSTTLGWVRGAFSWQGDPYLPCIGFAGSREPLVIVSSSQCRRPQVGVEPNPDSVRR
jgi:hypothetical protein